MIENAKNEMTASEADAYFERNMKKRGGAMPVSTGCKLLEEFLDNVNITMSSCLEIGCCYGYNLAELSKKYDLSCYGVEPSKKAVEYGNRLYKDSNVILNCATSEELPFGDEFFDLVIVGFSWFWVERKLLLRSVAEADRVLKQGGYLAIYDFDTKLPYIRKNIHNDNVPTFKMDIAKILCNNPQYVLAEKRSFSDDSVGFAREIQERCALNIFYKELVENAYIQG